MHVSLKFFSVSTRYRSYMPYTYVIFHATGGGGGGGVVKARERKRL